MNKAVDELENQIQRGETQFLEVVQGSELKIFASNQICRENSFMHVAYRQAVRATAEVVRSTIDFHKAAEKIKPAAKMDDLLFRYSGNIVAFVAQRGAGKTQTMLSFSQILEENSNAEKRIWDKTLNEDACKRLPDCQFSVMAPIAPSSLEKNQSFLYVVLSRIYRYVEDLIQQKGPYGNTDAALLDKLWQQFNKCLSGINGVKKTEDHSYEDLSMLQNVSDGIALRRYFYELVQSVLRLRAGDQKFQDFYLVLQVDDADSQIENGYSVLEDMRRYLVIPNLIILMSADIRMLHNVILQDHLRQFPDLKDVERKKSGESSSAFLNELSRMCRKYIDKLIPPSHMVHLPRLDKYIELSGNSLQLKYIDRDGRPVLPWSNVEGEDWDLQKFITMLIYRKTGIVFVSHSVHLNNIVPRTLRGLNQLIYLLSEMEDIPRRPEGYTPPIDSEHLAQLVADQLPIAEDNLSRFSDYFTNDWIEAKVSRTEDRNFLRKLSAGFQARFVQETLEYLKDRFPAEAQSNKIPALRGTAGLYDLDKFLLKLEEEQRSEDDFLLIFAIRTLRSIESHRLVWRQKRKALKAYYWPEENRKEGPLKKNLLLFDFDPRITHLPSYYPVSDKAAETSLGKFITAVHDTTGRPTTVQMDSQLSTTAFSNFKRFWKKAASPKARKGSFNEADPKVVEVLLQFITCKDGYGKTHLNFLGLITLFLRIGAPDFHLGLKETDSGVDTPLEQFAQAQSLLYQMQELALLVACNWDVQVQIYRKLPEKFQINELSKSSSEEPLIEVLGNIQNMFGKIDAVIQDINDGTIYRHLALEDSGKYSWNLGTAFFYFLVKNEHSIVGYNGELRKCFDQVFEKPTDETKQTRPSELGKGTGISPATDSGPQNQSAEQQEGKQRP